MSTKITHNHSCKACGKIYHHTHATSDVKFHTENPDQQFDFQCPYPDCTMFSGNGTARNNVKSTRGAAGDKIDQPKRSTDPEDKLAKNIRIRYMEGDLSCDRREHYQLIKKKDEKYSKAIRKSNKTILEMMQPFKTASCDCERDAVKSMWGNNTLGTFQNHYVANGNYHKGFGEIDPKTGPKTVCPLSYSLTDGEFKILHARFPGWLFHMGNGHHDHPVAHTSNIIVNWLIMKNLTRRGRVLDICGSPNANARFNTPDKTVVETACRPATPKDIVRQNTKWTTPYHDVYLRDVQRIGLEKFDHFTMFHCLYYFPMSELSERLMSHVPGKTLTATMHRFVGKQGTMNGGEQKWTRFNVNGKSMIEQVNVKTGEKYIHDDNEHWFQQTSWRHSDDIEKMANDLHQSMAWTINEGCDGTYTFTIVATPNRLHTADITPIMSEELQKQRDAREAERSMIEIGEHTVILKVPQEHVKLHDFLVSSMHSVERNEKSFKAHMKRAAIKATSMMQSQPNYSITSDELHDVAMNSFWRDHRQALSDKAPLKSAVSEFYRQQVAFMTGSNYVQSKRMLKDIIQVAINVVQNADSKKKLALALLHQADTIFDRETE